MILGNIEGLINGTEQVVFDYEVPPYTAALLNFQGANGATTTTEESGKTVTFNGGAQISTAVHKYGTSALKLTNAGDFVSLADHADWFWGTGPVTIRMDVNFTSDEACFLICQFTSGNNNPQVSLYYDQPTHRLQFLVYNSGYQIRFSAPFTPVLGQWHNIVVSRISATDASTHRIFVDGVSQTLTLNDGSWSYSFIDIAGPLYIGGTSGTCLKGYIGCVQIFKGTSVYTHDFTVSSTAPTYVAGGPVTYIDTGSVLNGNEDGLYTIIARHIGANIQTGIQIRLNNDSGANYGWRGTYAGSATVGDEPQTGQTGLTFNVDGTPAGYTHLSIGTLHAKSGAVRTFLAQAIGEITGTTVSYLGKYGEVWNNSVDNITSMRFITTGAGSNLGVGTRIIIIKHNNFTNGTSTGVITTPYIKGSWARVDSQVLQSAQQNITFSNLDGDRDVIYAWRVSQKVGAGGGTCPLRMNGDSGAKYGHQVLQAYNTTIHAQRNTGATSVDCFQQYNPALNSMAMNCGIMFAKSGFARPMIVDVIEEIPSGTTTVNALTMHGGVYNNIADNLTSININGSVANFYGAGTVAELYALRPNG